MCYNFQVKGITNFGTCWPSGPQIFWLLSLRLLYWWWLLRFCQVYVDVLPLLRCRYCMSRKMKLGRLSSSVCTLLTMHFLQSVPHIRHWWFSGAIYWYFSITVTSHGGHSCCRHRMCKRLQCLQGKYSSISNKQFCVFATYGGHLLCFEIISPRLQL